MSFIKLSDDELQKLVPEFVEVIRTDQAMPENIDPILLLRLLKFFNGNITKALARLRANMELRNNFSDIFYNRDTTDPQLRRLINQIEMFFLPQVTAKNNRILMMRLIEFDADQIIPNDALSVFSMVYDTSVVMPEEGRLADGEIVIFDLKGMTAKHIARLGISALKCFFKYMIEVHPIRIKEVHVVNSYSLLDKLMLILRPFLGAKAMKVIHFHSPNSTTLYDFVPKDLLPDEYGGSIGPLDTPKWLWIHRTEDHREYLLDDDRWKLRNESKDVEQSIEDSFHFFGFC